MNAARLLFALAAPLLLASCFLTPGKFVSSIDIRKDRSFTFAYAGEVIAVEEVDPVACDPEADETCDRKEAEAARTKRLARDEASYRKIAAQLLNEPGYRSVQYLGNRKFRVDYAIEGKLDRSFVYPFNSEAAAIFPWVAVELRKDGTARISAPGFGEAKEEFAGSTNRNDANEREGSFTLTTNAEVVMQNEERGAADGSDGSKRIVWEVTPTSMIVPTAILRFAP